MSIVNTSNIQGHVLLLAFVVMIACVIIRSKQLKKLGIRAIHFGDMDKKDFLIPPFVLVYFYLIVASVFHLPRFSSGIIIKIPWIGSLGAILCICAPIIFIWGIHSFGKSFRVGIDENTHGDLITNGAFAISRNPLYLGFFMMLMSVFLIYPTWIFFFYFVGGLWLIDRQVNLEENSLRKIYGKSYDEYCEKVRRYI